MHCKVPGPWPLWIKNHPTPPCPKLWLKVQHRGYIVYTYLALKLPAPSKHLIFLPPPLFGVKVSRLPKGVYSALYSIIVRYINRILHKSNEDNLLGDQDHHVGQVCHEHLWALALQEYQVLQFDLSDPRAIP